MLILGIETSCDETSAAIVEETGDAAKPWAIRSNVIASQAALHREWGGVVPELASRQHIRDICGVVERALEEAGASWRDLGAVAVTQGPGLVGSLLVGVSFAKAAAAAAGLPLVAVHHLAGHIESLILQNGEMPLPAIVLVVSGGHTSLYLVERPGTYELLSRTRDDAAGEAYDKVAKLLGLGYPGGPVIDALAIHGNPKAVKFVPSQIKHGNRGTPKAQQTPYDFSFSGIKKADLRHVELEGMRESIVARQQALAGIGKPKTEEILALCDKRTLDLVASFQRAVVEDLVGKTLQAAEEREARTLFVTGGVAANRELRETFALRSAKAGLPAYFPSRRL